MPSATRIGAPPGRYVVHGGRNDGPVGRNIGEVHAAIAVGDDVVGAAEGLALVVIRQDRFLACRPHNARAGEAGLGLKRDQPTVLRVERHSQRAVQIAHEGDGLVVLVQPHDAVGPRLRKDDADVRQPEGVVRTRQALDHHLRHRAALDDAGDVGSWLKLRGIGWRLRKRCGNAQSCGQREGQRNERLACHGNGSSTDRDDGYRDGQSAAPILLFP
jgi:hypothetical protein